MSGQRGGYSGSRPASSMPPPPATPSGYRPPRQRLTVDVTAVQVPAEGHVFWVATLPDDALHEDAVDDLLVHLHAEAERAAPGRSTVIALAESAGLQVLDDAQLLAIGLRRVDPAEDAPEP